MKDFGTFLDKKARDKVKQLKIVSEILSRGGFHSQPFLEGIGDPYVYVRNPDTSSSFGGIRIYKIGDTIAYRIQRRPDSNPYGKAYELNIEEMFNDLISDDYGEEKAGKKVMQGVIGEIRKFFNDSTNADRDLRNADTSVVDATNRIIIGAGGTDYSNNVLGSY